MRNPTHVYQTATIATLEKICVGKCECCGEDFSETNMPDIAARCHRGPAFVAYWDGYLYLDCGKCKKPIVRVPVDRSILQTN